MIPTKPETQEAAVAQCAALGLHPLHAPMGDGHHTDVAFSQQDKEIGDALAWFLGTSYADIDRPGEWVGGIEYPGHTSVDEWTRVARALRIHGLRITNASSEWLGEAIPPTDHENWCDRTCDCGAAERKPRSPPNTPSTPAAPLKPADDQT